MHAYIQVDTYIYKYTRTYMHMYKHAHISHPLEDLALQLMMLLDLMMISNQVFLQRLAHALGLDGLGCVQTPRVT